MIVGAYLAFGRGAAYIFYQHAGSWIPQTKLEPTAFGSKQFGFSVAISNDYAVVGDPLALDGGVTYLYRRNGSSWVMLDQITAGDAETNDNFGDSVNIDPNSGLAIVGAPNVCCFIAWNGGDVISALITLFSGLDSSEHYGNASARDGAYHQLESIILAKKPNHQKTKWKSNCKEQKKVQKSHPTRMHVF
jgi:hypothetical protein